MSKPIRAWLLDQSGKVLVLTDWVGRQLHISSEWASRFGFVVLWGAGMTFIQVEEYALAIFLWILSALVLLAKAIRWKGSFKHPGWSTPIRVVYVIAAISFVPLSIFWTQTKRGKKPWSALQASAVVSAPAGQTDSRQKSAGAPPPKQTDVAKTIHTEPGVTRKDFDTAVQKALKDKPLPRRAPRQEDQSPPAASAIKYPLVLEMVLGDVSWSATRMERTPGVTAAAGFELGKLLLETPIHHVKDRVPDGRHFMASFRVTNMGVVVLKNIRIIVSASREINNTEETIEQTDYPVRIVGDLLPYADTGSDLNVPQQFVAGKQLIIILTLYADNFDIPYVGSFWLDFDGTTRQPLVSHQAGNLKERTTSSPTPSPTYEQRCEGSACAQGPNSQATFNQYGAPKLVMTDPQKQAIKNAMSPFLGIKVSLSANNATTDSQKFTADLAQALRDAGMLAEFDENWEQHVICSNGPCADGITIAVSRPFMSAATTLATVIKQEKLNKAPIPIEEMGEGTEVFHVIVTPNH